MVSERWMMIKISVERAWKKGHNMSMQGGRISPWCIYFRLAGVPTVIHPSSWLVLLVLGVMAISPGGTSGVFAVAFFVIAGMLCLLVHEYGHALTCRAFGGGNSVIQIASLGGLTRSEYTPPTRLGRILMVLAGPGASLALAVVAGVVLGAIIGDVQAGVLFSLVSPLTSTWGDPWLLQHVYMPVQRAVYEGSLPQMIFLGFDILFFVCVWWSLFNLVPVFPLDGGQALRLISGNDRLTARVGVAVSAVLLVWFLVDKNIYMAAFMAYFLYLNWQYMKSIDT